MDIQPILKGDNMPYRTNPNNYAATHQVPQHLEHKPVFAMPYEHFDGMYSGNTDAFYLSVGIAQYDANEISAKVMRNTGNQWSRQAEELPLHRCIDLSILISKVLFDSSNGQVDIRGGTYTRQNNEVILTQEPRTVPELSTFSTWLQSNGTAIKGRLNALCDVLNELRRTGKI
jgi:hypothetical protein